jgi:hypothetical protein
MNVEEKIAIDLTLGGVRQAISNRCPGMQRPDPYAQRL